MMTIQGRWASSNTAGWAGSASPAAGHHRGHTQTHRHTDTQTLTGLLLLEVAPAAVAADEDDVEDEQEGADGGDGDDGHPREGGRRARLVPVSDVADGRRTC